MLFLLSTDRPKLSKRIKLIIKNMVTTIYTTLANVNLFPLRNFGSATSRTTAKQLGRLATRLYIVLLTVSLIILILYTVIQPQLLKKTFATPSLDIYERLLHDHSETLECPCSTISIPYQNFITIEPVYHPVRTLNI